MGTTLTKVRRMTSSKADNQEANPGANQKKKKKQ